MKTALPPLINKPIVDASNLKGYGERPVRGLASALDALEGMARAAGTDNLHLIVVSSHRSYQSQQVIWENKFQGRTPIQDDCGRALTDFDNLEAKCEAIARWSAPPGLSRHHWGTDFDIFLREPIDQGYRPKLVPEEFEGNGVCSRLHAWLDENMAAFGFYRPYQGLGSQGVGSEPWHVSFRPLAEMFGHQITNEPLLRLWDEQPFLGVEWAKANVSRLIQQFLLPLEKR